VSPRVGGTGGICTVNFADAAELRRAFELCVKMERQFSSQVRLSEVEVDHGNHGTSHSSSENIGNIFSVFLKY
jgi:hypothetical protein